MLVVCGASVRGSNDIVIKIFICGELHSELQLEGSSSDRGRRRGTPATADVRRGSGLIPASLSAVFCSRTVLSTYCMFILYRMGPVPISLNLLFSPSAVREHCYPGHAPRLTHESLGPAHASAYPRSRPPTMATTLVVIYHEVPCC